MWNYAMAAALGGLLAFTAAAGFEQLSPQPVAAGAAGQGVHVAQYCAPPYESPDVRFYCREEVACQGPAGAATFACFM
jgi:hypothetical protein